MTFTDKVKRGGSLFGAAAFAFVLVAQAVPAQASAYQLLSARSIQLSNTAQKATNVVHKVGVTTTTADQSLGSMVIEYCQNSPIIGEACTAPIGFDTKFATPLSVNNQGGVTGFSVHQTASTANKVVLTRTASVVPANTAISLELGTATAGLTNPDNTNTTFYARITTHSSADGTLAAQDAGGVAMSTDNQLNVTAKVQETLTFCVFTGAACSDGGTAINLGDANGVLSNTATTYTKTAKYALASNALSGVTVRLKGDILKSGSFDITSHGAACTADSTATTAEQFGIRLSTVGLSQTADANYACAAGSHAFDTLNTNTLYGDTLATTTGASDSSVSEIEFAAKAAGTTEAGVYKSTMTLIATAKY